MVNKSSSQLSRGVLIRQVPLEYGAFSLEGGVGETLLHIAARPKRGADGAPMVRNRLP